MKKCVLFLVALVPFSGCTVNTGGAVDTIKLFNYLLDLAKQYGYLVLVFALILASTGCSWTTASDRAVIHDHYLNATAINAKVQADDDLPIYVRTWWAAEEKTWSAMDKWAKGEKFPTTSPAGGQ